MDMKDVKSDTIAKAGVLDRRDILGYLFHPRRAPAMPENNRITEVTVDVGDDAVIGCRLHMAAAENPNILFFHGNGEIAHDYDAIAPAYLSHDLNIIVADYRGYGISTGSPSITAMLSDAYRTFDHINAMLEDGGHIGPLWVMGRSLGSAPAIELAANRRDRVAGLIVESGFAGVRDLLARLGILPKDLEGSDVVFFSNADSIKHYPGPVLIIHAEHDHIIPLDHGRHLYESAPGPQKSMEIIEGADHNNIFALAGMRYFEYIRTFIDAQAA